MGMFVGPIHHVCVTVSDMEKALSFWRDTLGWEVIMKVPPRGSDEMNVLIGVPGRSSSVLLSQANAGFNGMVELIEFSSHSGKPFPSDEKFSDVGLRLLSFVVSDIDVAYEELQAKGCIFHSPPRSMELRGGAVVKACIFREPVDGIQIEIFQYSGDENAYEFLHPNVP